MAEEEKLYIVDKNDAVLAVKTRAELTNNDCWRIVSIWITNDQGQILLQKRQSDKQINPGVWTAATEGTVDYGEDYITAAKRELAEEIDLDSIELKVGKKYYGKWGNFGSRQCQSYFGIFNGEISDLSLQEDEVAALKWFTLDEIEVMYQIEPELFPLYTIYEFFGFLRRRQ